MGSVSEESNCQRKAHENQQPDLDGSPKENGQQTLRLIFHGFHDESHGFDISCGGLQQCEKCFVNGWNEVKTIPSKVLFCEMNGSDERSGLRQVGIAELLYCKGNTRSIMLRTDNDHQVKTADAVCELKVSKS